jgi:alpha-mannosidase
VGAIALPWSLDPAGGGRIEGRTTVSLLAGSPIVRVRIELDNEARDHRLRLRCPVGIAGPALAGGQLTTVRRSPVRVDPGEFPAETPLPTAPAHRFVAAASGKRGLALLAPGFFEYEWAGAGSLLVTVLRAVGELSRDDLPTRPGHAGWPVETPDAQEPGRHVIELAVAPVDGEDLGAPGRIHRSWEDAFLPPITLWMRQAMVTRDQEPGLELEGDQLAFEALKPAEDGDGLVLRFVNLAPTPAHARCRFPWPLLRAERARADETRLGPLALPASGSRLELEIGGHELASIRLWPADPRAP